MSAQPLADPTRDNAPSPTLRMLALSALAMSVGWGFRGDYGHEAGAMVPGALLGLCIAMTSGRSDWIRRATLLAMLGAIGWAFGGQMSYGRIIGYTAHVSFPTVAYGYASLFIIGALWSGIGSAVLALGMTESRSTLERFSGPLVAVWLVWLLLDFSGTTGTLVQQWDLFDTDWVAAASALLTAGMYAVIRPRARSACALIVLLSTGWCIGFGVLTLAAGLHMTPPRSDNWSGCVGLFAGALLYLWLTRNRAGLWFTGIGTLAGGVGFAVSDLVNMLGRAQWGPIGQCEWLHGLDYWKWMEQLFGLIMGFGVAVGALRLVRDRLAPPQDDRSPGALAYVAPLFLLVVMMWENLFKNVRTWARGDHIPDHLFGLGAGWWFLLIGVLLSAVIVLALRQYRRAALPLVPLSPFGRAQFLFLLILWIAVIGAFLQAFPGMAGKGVFFVHVTFWLTAIACTLIVVSLNPVCALPFEPVRPARAFGWLPTGYYWSLWLLMPLLIWLLAHLSVASHEAPLGGSHLRFPDPAYP